MLSSNGADGVALERSYSVASPLDVVVAKELLAEVRDVLEDLGAPFFLRQGTCLGAVRDGAFIPWDDDVDIGSIIGSSGVQEATIPRAVSAFQQAGFFVRVDRTDQQVSVSMMKSWVRIDWTCYRVIDHAIAHYPALRMPVTLFSKLKDIEFLGSKFCVPNPPEEYLRRKYGPEWMTPKRLGFEADVLEQIPAAPLPDGRGRLSQLLKRLAVRTDTTKLRLFDAEGERVIDGEVWIVGVGRFKTNRFGYTKFHLPRDDWYALVVTYGGHKELLYQEKMSRGVTHVYRADPSTSSGRLNVLSIEPLGALIEQ